MFGALVICLPSEHEGGAVNLQHGTIRERYQTSPTSKYNVSYISWYASILNSPFMNVEANEDPRYADVSHEVSWARITLWNASLTHARSSVLNPDIDGF